MKGEASHPRVDPSRCAICGEPNECALAGEPTAGEVREPCWCVREVFPEAVLERVADAERGRRCVCRRCLQAWSESPDRSADRA
jgi:hypothetical protein